MMQLALMSVYVVGGYIVGALPVGYWYARLLHNIDITQHGSGNIGATNCERVLGGQFTFAVIFIADALKSFGYLWLIQHLVAASFSYYAAVAGMVLFGNGVSCFLGGKGGKGVSTYVGIITALTPQLLLPFIFAWLAGKWATRSSAVASVCAVVLLPLFYYSHVSNYTRENMIFLSAVALWITLRHWSNIKASFLSN